jgi:hypothetical protein
VYYSFGAAITGRDSSPGTGIYSHKTALARCCRSGSKVLAVRERIIILTNAAHHFTEREAFRSWLIDCGSDP